MLSWAREMFPMPRSLTGEGVRQTLAFLSNLNPILRIHAVKSGAQVLDWEVPDEWKIREAYLEHLSSGQRFAEFKNLNLHVVGYSEPVDQVMTLSELKPRIFTHPDEPTWVPYVTSYYNRTWGFCMSEKEKNSLPQGEYRVVIDSELFDGEMLFADATIVGKSEREVFFSTYICHPSMANNELSGPVLISALMQYVREKIQNPRFSYRFVLIPETVGALAYLQNNLHELKKNVICGFNLSCVGDDRSYTHIESRLGSTLADRALEASFLGLPNAAKYSFLLRGSDERQYCAPGVDLPLAGFCRTRYRNYPEYHTDADNFDVVTETGLQGSFDLMTTIIRVFEAGLYPKVTVLGEPQLGKRGLYPTTSQQGARDKVRARMDFLSYADGRHSIFDIAKLIQVPLPRILDEMNILRNAGLIELSDDPWP